MARPYSEAFLRKLSSDQNEFNNLGIQLAKVCTKANLPMLYVAKALDVSKLTVFHWFRGRDIRQVRRPKVYAFIALTERDTADGKLPAVNIKAAKAYIEDMIGHEI